MKRVVLACLGMMALVASAGAADMPARYGRPAFVIPVYNWTGFYIGINGGGAWGDTKWSSIGTFDVSGAMIGGTAGYNWQLGPWVLGLEGDADWTNINGSSNAFCAQGCKTSNSWLATVRAAEDKSRAKMAAEIESSASPPNPLRVCAELGKRLGKEDIVIGDGGDFVATAAYVLKLEWPQMWMDPGPLGTIGVGPGYAMAAKLARPEANVVLVYGDSHYFRIDKPLVDSSGKRLENFTRLETFGDNAPNGLNDVHWVKVLVDPSSRDVFAFEPQIVPANRVAVAAPTS